MLTTWTGSWAAVFVIAAIFNIVAAVMALAVLRRCDAEPRHRLREKYAAAISGAKRSFSQNNAIAVRRPVNEITFDVGQHPTSVHRVAIINGGTSAFGAGEVFTDIESTAPACSLYRYPVDSPAILTALV